MDRERKKIDDILRGIVDNVYYQPPTNIHMKYPCIVYKRNLVRIGFADNIPFNRFKGYIVTFIHKSPDDETNNKLLELQGIRFDRSYSSDNLIHDVYEVNFL
jgi:hypothetical protein